METNILVTRPGTLDQKDKELLRESGVIVVEADNPDDVRFLRPEADLAHGDMLYAAMQAIACGTLDNQKEKFANAMAAIVKANRDRIKP